jgi:hypothetical protein
MAKLYRIVVAATLSAHLLMGCCWHHAHACDNHEASNPAVSTAEKCHEEHSPCDGVDAGRHDSQVCLGGTCVFVRGDSAENILQHGFLGIAAIPLPDMQTLMRDIQSRQYFSAPAGSLLLANPPSNNQVLLI